MSHTTFCRVARSLTLTRRLENRVRPLLDALTAATGLDVAMLARLHAPEDRLEVLWCHHAHRLGVVVPEQVSKPWSTAFSNKAFEDAVHYTPIADELWPECAAGGSKVRTFAGHPVRDGQGRLFGTLCAVSNQRLPMPEDLSETVETYARLIGLEVEHEQIEAEMESALERRRVEVLAEGARRMANPRRMVAELERVFALARHEAYPIGEGDRDALELKTFGEMVSPLGLGLGEG